MPRVGLHEPHADRGILQLRDGGTVVLVLYGVLLEEREGKEEKKKKVGSPVISHLLARLVSWLSLSCKPCVLLLLYFIQKTAPRLIRSGPVLVEA